MSEEKLAAETIEYIASRLIDRANEAMLESAKDRNNPFNAGHAKAYCDMVGILQSKLRMTEQDLKALNLDMDLLRRCTG